MKMKIERSNDKENWKGLNSNSVKSIKNEMEGKDCLKAENVKGED